MFFDDPVNVCIGSNVRKFRQARGLSMKELGCLAGTSYQQIYKYETGEDRISASRLYKVAQALDEPLARFFGGLAVSGKLTKGAALYTNDDRAVRRSLARIHNVAVRQALQALIITLADRKVESAAFPRHIVQPQSDRPDYNESHVDTRRAITMVPDAVDLHIGQKLIELRQRLGLSRNGAAKKMGVVTQQLRKYETAQNRVSTNILYRIATALDQEVGYFYEGLPHVEERRSTSKGNWKTLRTAEILESIQDAEIRRTVLHLIHLVDEQAFQKPSKVKT